MKTRLLLLTFLLSFSGIAASNLSEARPDFKYEYKFVDDKYLLISQRTTTSETQKIINLKTGGLTTLGGGVGELISWDGEEGLIKLRGQKRYFPAPEFGAFWVDVIVDTKGNIIEYVEPNSQYLGKCVPIKELIDLDKKHPKLKQGMDDCVRVER